MSASLAASATLPTLRKFDRYEWLDVLRALAIGDIVGFHTTHVYPLGGMGLQVFLICTFALSARRSPPRPVWQLIRLRARRLLVPWLIWSAIYGLYDTLRAAIGGNPQYGDLAHPRIEFLWTGTAPLLWYLPFAFVAEVLINLYMHGTDRVASRCPKVFIAGGLVAGAALLIAIPLTGGDALLSAGSFSIWLRASTLIPMGIGLGMLLRYFSRHLTTRVVILITGAVLLAAYALAIRSYGAVPAHIAALWLRRCGLGIVLIAGALCVPGRPPAWLMRFAGHTFTIYLVHGIITWPAYKLLTLVLRTDQVPGVAFWLLTWAGALVFSVVARRLVAGRLKK